MNKVTYTYSILTGRYFLLKTFLSKLFISILLTQ
jgi:hypothetical protein